MEVNIDNLGAGMSAPALSETEGIKCESCGGQVFIPAYLLRKVSKLLIGAKNDGVIPIDTFCCAKCGNINKEFIPVALQDEFAQSNVDKENETLVLR